MTDYRSLLPDLASWNDGKSIAPDEWAYITSASDQALGYIAIFWPDFVEVEGMILRASSNVEEKAKARLSAGEPQVLIEQHLNFWDFGTMFSHGEDESDLLDKRREQLCYVMSEMLSVKLTRDYPDRTFKIHPSPGGLDDDDNLEVTFLQPRPSTK